MCAGDNDARDAFKQAKEIQFGQALRHFFVNLVVQNMVKDVPGFWEEFKEELSEDFAVMEPVEMHVNGIRALRLGPSVDDFFCH